MIKVNLIVARSQNGIIGKDNRIPWNIPADLKHFQNLTTCKAVVMGRNTYASIGMILPNRLNIVVSSEEHHRKLINPNLVYVTSLHAARTLAKEHGHSELWVIGGERLYKEAMSIVNELYITEVLTTIPYTVNDTVAKFNPDIDPMRWDKIEQVRDNYNDLYYDFTRYVRVRGTPNKNAVRPPVISD